MKKLIPIILTLCLFLTSCGLKNENKTDKLILKYNDSLYYGTDETGPMGDSGCVAGEIISSVKSGEIPTENGQSNFGCVGNPYTKEDGDGRIMVMLDDEIYYFFIKMKD